MNIDPIVLGFLIALAVFPWIIIAVHMYVYHWRKNDLDKALEDFSRYGCLPEDGDNES